MYLTLPPTLQTPAHTRVVDAVNDAIKAGWEVVPHPYLCIRYTESDVPMPEMFKRAHPYDTYERHIFVSLIIIRACSKLVVNICTDQAPWLEARTRRVSLREAVRILRTPETELN